MLKQILAGTRDVTDSGLEVDSEHRDLRVVVTRKTTEIGGRVLDGNDRPPLDGIVLVFAEDASLWTPHTRHVATARPDPEGRFVVKNLPPATYLAVALDFIEDGAWEDPDVLESLRRSAVTVRLGEGEHLTMPLTLASDKR